jgi:hypothetical protein
VPTKVDPHVRLFNPDPADRKVNANALFFYAAAGESPLLTVAAIGHLVNLTPTGPVSFETGSDVRTMPFRVETGQLGKPLDDFTTRDLAHLKATYKLPQSTPFSILRRERLQLDVVEQFDRDLDVYVEMYQQQRDPDISRAFEESLECASGIKVKCPARVPLLFSVDALPAPTESAVFDTFFTDAPLETKVFVILWNLVRRPHYLEHIGRLADASGLSPSRLAVHLQSKPDGSWCLAIERHQPLALKGPTPEIAHFHRVASSREAATMFGERFSVELQRQFDVSYTPEVLVDGSGP